MLDTMWQMKLLTVIPKNIGYRVKKGEVLGFKKNRKLLMISLRKVHVDRFLKSTKFSFDILK